MTMTHINLENYIDCEMFCQSWHEKITNKCLLNSWCVETFVYLDVTRSNKLLKCNKNIKYKA